MYFPVINGANQIGIRISTRGWPVSQKVVSKNDMLVLMGGGDRYHYRRVAEDAYSDKAGIAEIQFTAPIEDHLPPDAGFVTFFGFASEFK